jgi:hypothetical protein
MTLERRPSSLKR